MPLEAQHRQWLAQPTRTGTIDPAHLAIEPDDIIRAMGYRIDQGQTAAPHTVQSVTDMTQYAQPLLHAAFAWSTLPVSFNPDEHALSCGSSGQRPLAVGSIVSACLGPSSAAAVFVVTIGPQLESAARQLMSTDRELDGYVLDTMGSLKVEACADYVHRLVTESAACIDWQVTNRYSPGYCTWPTHDQHALMRLLPPNPAGVALGDGALMTPIKSINGLIGLGQEVQFRPYSCEFCKVKDCFYRYQSPAVS